jgi:FkbM family methyltransferase
MRHANVELAGIARPLRFGVHDDNDKHISEHLIANGVWEAFETQLIMTVLSPGDLVVDCGANIGWYSVVAAALGARVAAFEPMPANAALLRHNCLVNAVADRVTIFECALGASAGTTTLHLSTDNQGDHRVASVHDTRASIEVDVRTLDDALAPLLHGQPRLIKLDTQGSEVNILRGGRSAWAPRPAAQAKSVQADRVQADRVQADRADRVSAPYIVMEFWPYGLATCGSNVDELLDLLSEIVDFTHTCSEIQEWDRSLTPRSMTDLRAMAHHGGYSEAMKGFTNLWLQPIG